MDDETHAKALTRNERTSGKIVKATPYIVTFIKKNGLYNVL